MKKLILIFMMMLSCASFAKNLVITNQEDVLIPMGIGMTTIIVGSVVGMAAIALPEAWVPLAVAFSIGALITGGVELGYGGVVAISNAEDKDKITS